MVNFIPGANREFFGNRAKWNPAKTTGQYYGGPSQVAGAGLAAPLSPPQRGGPLPPFGGNAERPGVYGNPGQFNPMPRGPLPDLPGGPRGNMDQPGLGGPLPPYQGGGVSGFDPNGIGTGVTGNPFTPDPNNITRGGGTMGGNAFAGNGMRRWGNRPLLANPNMRGL